MVEEEPLTLEKDKEDQSKYYLSYLKPSVLDMKSANHDINVVEWANISNFSVLDNLVTPLRLLEFIFVTYSRVSNSRGRGGGGGGGINGKTGKNAAIRNLVEIKSSNDLVKISPKRTSEIER